MGAFAFLFSEIVQYSQTRVSNVSELERKLADVGFDVGVRMLELLVHREKAGKRENRILGILSFLHTNVWKNLFGKTADSLERGTSVSTLCPPPSLFWRSPSREQDSDPRLDASHIFSRRRLKRRPTTSI